MKKAIVLTIVGLVILIGALAGIKALQIRAMIAQGKNYSPPPAVVTATPVAAASWESRLTAIGSITAVQGVTVTAEVTGKVTKIAFEAGSRVEAGDLLVQQDIAVEQTELRAAESVAELARIEFERSKKLLANNVISPSDFDSTRAHLTQSKAQADNIRAIIDKKTIRAPFAGRLGIREINLGQVLKEGQAIVSLQSLDPVFVNFSLPQQHITQVKTGLLVRVTSDALPGKTFDCKITAINPQVDVATRNIQIQATLKNPDEQLRAGMFVNVAVILPAQEKVLTIPATAVLYAPYSDSVFVIEEKKKENGSSAGKVIRQQFVRLGERRGDFVSVISGLTAQDTIVSTGAFKLRNGQSVVIDNKLAPTFKLDPQPSES